MKASWWKSAVLFLSVLALVSCGGGGGGGGGTTGGGGGTLSDLVVTTFSAPSSGVAGSSVTVSGTIKNQGGVMGAAAAVINLSPNSDVRIDGGQVGMDVYMGFLGAGQSWNFSTTITLPSNIANGTYSIGAVAMGDDPSVSGNNVKSQTITITGGTTCTKDSYEDDNTYSAANPLTFAVSQQHNHCEGTSDWMTFSATGGQVYGASAARVGSKASPVLSIYDTDGSTLLANTSYAGFLVSRATWTAPRTGTYYVKAAPFMGTLSSGANTEYIVTVGDRRPDLVVDRFTAPSTGLPGGIIWVSDTVRNQGFADAGTFDVSVYLSTSSTVTTGSTWIGRRPVTSLAIDQSNSGSSLAYTLPALAPGTYYLATIVNDTGKVNEFTTANNTSTVLSIAIQSLGTCTADAYEPDNTALSTATTITVGAAAQSHNHCNDTMDWMKLAMTNGSSYAIRLTNNNLSTAWVELYDTDGTTKLAGGSGTTVIEWTATKTGTYYVLAADGSAGDGMDYTIQVQPKLPDLVEAVYLQNGTTAVAGGFLNVTDAVSNIGYQDAGAFEIGFYYSASSNVTTSDTLGATRSVVSLPYQGYQSTDTSWTNYVHFPKSLPTGTYYLAAYADRNNSVAELSKTNNMSAPVAVTVVAPPCAVDAYEDDDDIASAKPIAAGETQTRNFCDDDIDWVSFTPSASGKYVVSATNSVFFEPYHADGITPWPTYDTYYYSKFSLDATAGTTYYLKGYNGNGGAYQLTVFQCTPDAYEPDNTPALAKSIAPGQTQTRNHCEDGYDWAKFTAAPGTAYTITATNGQNVYLTLYDTDGQTILASGQSAQGGKQKVINWTAPAGGGTYYIEVNPIWGFGQNTDYTLSLK